MYHNSPDLDRIESVRLYVDSRTEIYAYSDTPLMYGGDPVKEIFNNESNNNACCLVDGGSQLPEYGTGGRLWTGMRRHSAF